VTCDTKCAIHVHNQILIKIFDGMMRELKDVKYVPQIKKNIISVGVLEAHGLEFSSRDRIFKLLKDLIVMLKGIRRNNLNYLKGNIVIGQLITSVDTNDDSTKL